ncbi:MAG: hypothetical protein AAF585_21365 [Verrucomicrobiota bacterium]
MKYFTHLSIATLACALFSCNSEPETEASVESEPGDEVVEISEPKPVEIPAPELTDEEIEKLIFGDGNEGLVPNNLTAEQQETLREAVEKATQEIDFSLLTTSIMGQLGNIQGLGDATITSSGATMKTLTPEEAKEMGLDLESLQNLVPGDGDSVQSNVQIITISADAVNTDGIDFDALGNIAEQGVTIESVEPIVIEEEPDPERAQRFQEALESG